MSFDSRYVAAVAIYRLTGDVSPIGKNTFFVGKKSIDGQKKLIRQFTRHDVTL